MDADPETQLASLRGVVLEEFGGLIESSGAAAGVLEAAQAWVRLDQVLGVVDISDALSTTQMVLEQITAVSPASAAVVLGGLCAEFEQVTLSLSGNPTVPREKQSVPQTSAVVSVVSILGLPNDF